MTLDAFDIDQLYHDNKSELVKDVLMHYCRMGRNYAIRNWYLCNYRDCSGKTCWHICIEWDGIVLSEIDIGVTAQETGQKWRVDALESVGVLIIDKI